MNLLDLAFLAILILSILGGLARGLIRELFGLFGVVVGFGLALLFSPALAAALPGHLPPAAAWGLSFIVIQVMALVISDMLGRLTTGMVEAVHLTAFNRFLGGVFGLARGAFLIALVFLGLSLVVRPAGSLIAGSLIAPYAERGARYLYHLIPERHKAGWPPIFEPDRTNSI